MKAMLLVAALGAALPAGASEWTQLATDKSGGVHYVHVGSIHSEGSLRRASKLFASAVPIPFGGRDYDSVEAVYEYDCSQRAGRLLTQRFHTYAAGLEFPPSISAAALPDLPGNGEWTPIQPDTVHGVFMDFVCKR